SVVTMADVNEVIANLGQATEMVDEEEAEAHEDQQKKHRREGFSQGAADKKIFRDPDEKVIGGVCAGLSHYIGVDVIYIRIFFIVIAAMAAGTGALIYAILWAIVPEAVTTADKLKMKGKAVNVSNIEQSIKDGFKTISDDINEFVNDPEKKARIKKSASEMSSFLQNFFEGLFEVLGVIFKIAARFIAVILIIAGIGMLAAMLFGFLSLVGSFSLFGFVFGDLLHLIMPNSLHATVFMFALLLSFIIPVIVILIRSFQLLLHQGKIGKPYLITAFFVWILSLLVLIGTVATTSLQFRSSATTEEEVPVQAANANCLYISNSYSQSHSMHGRHFGGVNWTEDAFYFDNEAFYYKDVRLFIEPSTDAQYHLIKRYRAQGSNFGEARENTNLIAYEVQQNDTLINLSPYTSISGAPYRAQNVTVVLQVPIGKKVKFMGYMNDIDCRSNHSHLWDHGNKTFIMRANGLDYMAGKSKSPVAENMMTYDFHDFNSVKVTSEHAVKVEVKQGPSFSVMVNNRLANEGYLKVSQYNDELEFDLDNFWKGELPDAAVHIQIQLPNLRRIEANGQGIYIVEIQDGENVELDFSGGTNGTFNGHTKRLEVVAEGISKVQLQGTTERLDAEISGSSELLALDMLSEYTEVDLSGICEAELHATERLNIEASGSSKVRYKGNPQISQDVSGIAQIEKIDN
ncbi:PspC domain-containing protein, partial [bacterium]|nr:PspC domain-containing protein [bacterium]